MSTLKLNHTSPEEKIVARSNGLFDEFIFFSSDAYAMTVGEYHVFTVEVDEKEIIEARCMFYLDNAEDANNVVEEVMNTYEVDEDEAIELLSETAQLDDLDIDFDEKFLDGFAEASWNLQRLTARAASALGFRGVAVNDEQGTAYMLPAALISA